MCLCVCLTALTLYRILSMETSASSDTFVVMLFPITSSAEILAASRQTLFSGLLTRFDIHWAVQPQKMAIGIFWIEEEKG